MDEIETIYMCFTLIKPVVLKKCINGKLKTMSKDLQSFKEAFNKIKVKKIKLENARSNAKQAHNIFLAAGLDTKKKQKSKKSKKVKVKKVKKQKSKKVKKQKKTKQKSKKEKK